jgi:peptidoglycan/LPS O-acetylase OafA/YrhL
VLSSLRVIDRAGTADANPAGPTGDAAQAIAPDAAAWLDAIRVFLIAEVILGHLAAIALPDWGEVDGGSFAFSAFVHFYRSTTRFGPQAAIVFVFLSGFFVGGPLLSDARGDERPGFAAFARRRLARLLPTLWIAVCLCAGLDLIGAYGFGAAQIYASQRAYDFLASLTPANFIGNLFCLEPTFVGPFGSDGPLWTLGYIVQFYLVGFPLLRGIAQRRLEPVAAVGALLLLAALLRPEWAALFAIWCLGAAARTFGFGHRLSPSVCLFGAAALFIAANRAPGLASILLCGGAGVLLVAWTQTTSARLASAPRRWLARLSGLGYDAYAIHYPVAFLLFAVLFRDKAREIASFATFSIAAIALVAVMSVAVHGAAGRLSKHLGWAPSR